MPNSEIYNKVFIDNLKVTGDNLNSLKYRSISSWDSVGHMVLIANLEESFDILIDTEDILNFTSYENGKQILKKYNVIIK